jgi:hypothetical protein
VNQLVQDYYFETVAPTGRRNATGGRGYRLRFPSPKSRRPPRMEAHWTARAICRLFRRIHHESFLKATGRNPLQPLSATLARGVMQTRPSDRVAAIAAPRPQVKATAHGIGALGLFVVPALAGQRAATA